MESGFSGEPAERVRGKSYDFTVEDANHFLVYIWADSVDLNVGGSDADRAWGELVLLWAEAPEGLE